MGRLGAARLGPSREAGKQRHGLEGGRYWPLSVPTDKVVAVKSQAPGHLVAAETRRASWRREAESV